jgi:capsular polysaccharide biosynthesis protein
MRGLDNALFVLGQFILEILNQHWDLNKLGLTELIGLLDPLFWQRLIVFNCFIANTEPSLPLVVCTSK